MNTTNPACQGETGALRGDLRPCVISSRPIHCLKTGLTGRVGGGR